MKKILTAVLLCGLSFGQFPLMAQQASEILQSLHALNTVGSVLYIAAHPDDENTRLLAYLAKQKNVRTAYLSLTRGDGGQNLIGKEQGEALGLVRTQELLAARKIDGAEQFFSRAYDFGFSKNPEETFSIWQKDSILFDVVLTIRRVKPDVIICRFPTTGEGGHGHHTASAILAQEAFDAAADPKRFPEQLTYVEVWQARRLFWNTFNFGGTNTTAPNQLKIDVGVYNPLLGKSCGEIAAESRSMHKSQGFGSANTRGEAIEYFKLLKGDTAKDYLCEGINLTWERFPQAKNIGKSLDKIIKQFNPANPELSVDALVEVYKQLQNLNGTKQIPEVYRSQKLKACANAILACSGIWSEAVAADYYAVPGSAITLSAQIIARLQKNVELMSITFPNGTDSSCKLALKQNMPYVITHRETLQTHLPYSNPYWLNTKHGKGMFTVTDSRLIGTPENAPACKVIFHLNISGLVLDVERPLQYKSTDPVKGEIYRAFEVLPPVTIQLPENLLVFNSNTTKTVSILVKANKDQVEGKLFANTVIANNFTVQLTSPDFMLKNKGDEAVVEAVIQSGNRLTSGLLQLGVQINDQFCNKSIKRIEYDHIPSQFILSNAEARLVKLDVKMTHTLIGYIPGAGDDIPTCLKQIGYTVVYLSDDMLSKDDLSVYGAIVTGIRAYNTNERLQVHYTKLMSYVEKGGNLVVQYNTNNRIGPVGSKIGPYPFTISRDRVTDDTAEVRFISPKHPALESPNKISNDDFSGWVQERGIYFATDIDIRYETIFSINDPNEKASEGSLLIGKYGKGNFVYSGLAFFRQLPAGVPGAYRVLSNLISLPKN